MIVTIDRLEGQMAVAQLPDGTLVSVPKALFEGAKEGQAYEIRPTENALGERVKRLMDEVWEND